MPIPVFWRQPKSGFFYAAGLNGFESGVDHGRKERAEETRERLAAGDEAGA